jgi:SNF2 family DNA or RNA helicase
VAPKSLILQWKDEIINYSSIPITVMLHYRTENSRLGIYDFVITTYETLNTPKGDTLYHVNLNGIILDEVHTIRNPRTIKHRNCCKLKGEIRWGLTGTPISNKYLDIYSIFKWIRLLGIQKPWCTTIHQATSDCIGRHKDKGIVYMGKMVNVMILRREKNVILEDLRPAILKNIKIP